MKKSTLHVLISALLTAVLLLTLSTTVHADSGDISPGDVNGDGKVSISDYTLIRYDILGLKSLPSEYSSAGDVNGDGKITISDYTLVRYHILGLKSLGSSPDSLPLSGRIIGIDPGHQAHANYDREPVSPGSSTTKAKVSAGTYGRFTGVYEYEINLQVALKLKEKLEALGAVVIMTRETHDVDISNSERAVMMNEAGVDCWLRIHANGSDDASTNGMFILVPAEGCLNTSDSSVYDESLSLADSLLNAALASTGANSYGIVPRSDQTGFNWSSRPVCNIEMGHMTNEEEDYLLTSDEYQEKIAEGLAQGFVDYFSG